MNWKKYLHFVKENKANSLIQKWYINNRELDPEDRFTWAGNDLAILRWEELIGIRWFVYDISQITKSRYTRTLPFVHKDTIKRARLWTHLWIIPRYVDVYDIALFRALIFNVSHAVQKQLINNYVKNKDTWDKIYFETISPVPIVMQDIEEIPVAIALEEIIGIKPPFVTYKFPEWDDGYSNTRVESMAESYQVSWEWLKEVK